MAKHLDRSGHIAESPSFLRRPGKVIETRKGALWLQNVDHADKDQLQSLVRWKACANNPLIQTVDAAYTSSTVFLFAFLQNREQNYSVMMI